MSRIKKQHRDIRLKWMREYCENRKSHQPIKGALYRARHGASNYDGPGFSGILKGEIIMVVSDPEVTWTDNDGNELEFPEWTNLTILHREKTWPITTLVEDRWYVWFERIDT